MLLGFILKLLLVHAASHGEAGRCLANMPKIEVTITTVVLMMLDGFDDFYIIFLMKIIMCLNF
jgi:hypothetical protein